MFFQECTQPVKKHFRGILVGIAAASILYSLVGIYKLDISFSLYPTILLAAFIKVLQMLLGVVCLTLYFPSKITQEAFDEWLSNRWSRSYRRNHPDAKSWSTPSWIWYASYIVGMLFFILAVIPVGTLMVNLPALADYIGLANEAKLDWLIEGMMSEDI